MLGDLEFRGHARPITEEFNLAANYHEQDVRNAEFYHTFGTATFHGAALLQRLKAEQKRTHTAPLTRAVPIPPAPIGLSLIHI